jgi:hypothetical protein
MLIEFYLMLPLIGVNQDSIGHSHIVVFFYQKAIGSKLHYVASMGLYCPAALDLYRDQAAILIPDDIVRLAG